MTVCVEPCEIVVPVFAAEFPIPILSALGGVVEAGVATEISTLEEFWPAATVTTVGVVTEPPPITPPVPPELLLEELPPPHPTAKQRDASRKSISFEDMRDPLG
jgi:hypothetical protein